MFSPEGFYCGRSPGVGFGLRRLLSSKRRFLCWYLAVNLIFLLWMLTKSLDQKKLSRDLDVERVFLSSHRLIFGQSDVSLGVFPHVEHVAGQNSVASWSFPNDFGRSSRLTGIKEIRSPKV